MQYVHFISLGCPKNRIDSEIMLGLLGEAGWSHTPDPEQADLIVVNTCGFVGDAKEESIEAILEMAAYRQSGRCRRLVVTGCLAQRYPAELQAELPEVDRFLGTGEVDAIVAAATEEDHPRCRVGEPRYLHDATTPRVNTFLPHATYLKVSEGCDNACTFCIIPQIRGPQRSRMIEDVVREAESLARRGIVELNLVAQDLTAYGHDLPGRPGLTDLLRALVTVEGIRWIRLHYAYPRTFPDELMDLIAAEEKICNYLDMPLQHAADPVLKAMRRGRDSRWVRDLLARLHQRIPDLTLRTAFIVGFPGETGEDFRQLCDFVEEQRFDRMVAFRYSAEEGTVAHDLPDQIPEAIKEERYHHLMAIQQRISREKQQQYLGRRLEVLVDGMSDETDLLLAARHRGQAPQVDGVVYINDGQAAPGDIVEVEVTEAGDYDLVGRVVE